MLIQTATHEILEYNDGPTLLHGSVVASEAENNGPPPLNIFCGERQRKSPARNLQQEKNGQTAFTPDK